MRDLPSWPFGRQVAYDAEMSDYEEEVKAELKNPDSTVGLAHRQIKILEKMAETAQETLHQIKLIVSWSYLEMLSSL